MQKDSKCESWLEIKRLQLGMLMRLKSLECQSFLSILGKEFLDLRESRLATARQHAYCERDNCHLSLSACYQSIACLLHCGRGPHTRRMNAKKQRTVAYLSGRGQMFLSPGAYNPSYATASARQCKCGCFSLPV